MSNKKQCSTITKQREQSGEDEEGWEDVIVENVIMQNRHLSPSMLAVIEAQPCTPLNTRTYGIEACCTCIGGYMQVAQK